MSGRIQWFCVDERPQNIPIRAKGGQTLFGVSSLARTDRNIIIYFLEGISDFIFILLLSPP